MLIKLMQWPENNWRCYLHIYYNPHRAADDQNTLIRKLLLCKQELTSGKLTPAHDQDYEQYFVIKETPVRGRHDYSDEAISTYRKRYAGFFVILTTRKMQALEALEIYRNKDVIEKTSMI